jgi:hypothetical protein
VSALWADVYWRHVELCLLHGCQSKMLMLRGVELPATTSCKGTGHVCSLHTAAVQEVAECVL